MNDVIAVDSGGTFTDCVVLDAGGRVTTSKAPSTLTDFSVGVMASVERAAQLQGRSLDDLLRETGLLCHGTTVATNALLTRLGARVGMVTTRGHEDTLIIGRTIQKAAGLSEAELSNLARLEKADPIVPRPLIKGVTERIDYKGTVVVPIDEDDMRRAVVELVDAGVEVLAVCFLWSFMNPVHEQAVSEFVEAEFPGVLVTVSHQVAPVIKEYERGATTALNAYLSPASHTYISALQKKLTAGGFRHDPVIMHSAGGVTSAEDAKNRAVALLSSGPAGGVLGAAAVGQLIGTSNIVTTDVGGTSFDVGLVIDGEPLVTSTPVFGKYHTALPVIDVASIGAGGGSVAWIEAGTGHLKVGPRSAGADPGPVCYALGGTEPTVTDANVVLGRIDPAYFLGGARALDVALAEAVIREQIAEPLGLSVADAAMGIIDILDARMADLVRAETIGRGYDPREFTLFAFGGAGPLHVGAYGVDVGADAVIVPAYSSVFSAFGIAGTDLVAVQQVSEPMIAPFDAHRLDDLYSQLERSVLAELEGNGIPRDRAVLAREIEMRYRGQVHEIRAPVPSKPLDADDLEALTADFRARYDRRYGRGAAYGEAEMEARTYLVRGAGRLVKPELQPQPLGGDDPSEAHIGERKVFFRELDGFAPTSVYRRERLKPNNRVPGPAVIEAADTTVLVHPDQQIHVDRWTNLRFERV